eukprot:m.29868 g.29868  ORF g.29868 m.29868 type:complete len:165 (-) comp9607_c0_seq2:219-713(-)
MPQMPPEYNAFTTYSWDSTLKIMKGMVVAGSQCSEGFNWRKKPPNDCSYGDVTAGRRTTPSQCSSLLHEVKDNICVANMLFLHGRKRKMANVNGFLEPGMYSAWNPEPFSVCSSSCELQQHEMTAGMLSNEKRLFQPINTMISRGWKLFHRKAYLHQYTQFGNT